MADHQAGLERRDIGASESKALGRGGRRLLVRTRPESAGVVHAIDPEHDPYALCGDVSEPLEPFDPPVVFETWRRGMGRPYGKCDPCTGRVVED